MVQNVGHPIDVLDDGYDEDDYNEEQQMTEEEQGIHPVLFSSTPLAPPPFFSRPETETDCGFIFFPTCSSDG